MARAQPVRCAVRSAVAFLVAHALVACGTTATVQTSTRLYEGTIEKSDREYVLVRTGNGDERVRRLDIVDIDHPGNVHGLIGGLIAGYGLVNVGTGLDGCKAGFGRTTDEATAFCVGLFIPLVVGTAIALWGGIVYAQSSNALRASNATVLGPTAPEPRAAPEASLREPDRIRATGRLPAGLYGRAELRPVCEDCDLPFAAALGGVYASADEAAVARAAFPDTFGAGYPFLAHTDELGTTTSTGVAVVLGLFRRTEDANAFAKQHRLRVILLGEPVGAHRVVELTGRDPVTAMRWAGGTVTATAACTLPPASAYVLDDPPAEPVDWIDAPCEGPPSVIDVRATRFNAVGRGRGRFEQVTAGGVVQRSPRAKKKPPKKKRPVFEPGAPPPE
ncbi:MAG: hypothetical protein RMA76_12565 [Deltaproteobacteria bacterium]|jgi:hypothetical protein